MEERKHLLAYVEQVFMVFGISIVALSAICVVAGEEAREISTMFALGAEGIPLNTLGQYLLSSVCITALRFVFFTDALIRRLWIIWQCCPAWTKRSGQRIASWKTRCGG